MYKKGFSIIDFQCSFFSFQKRLTPFINHFRIFNLIDFNGYFLNLFIYSREKIISTEKKYYNRRKFYKKLKENIANNEPLISKFCKFTQERTKKLLLKKSTTETEIYYNYDNFRYINE